MTRRLALLLTTLAAAGLATAGRAQNVPGGVGTLALLWAQGDYRAPLICEIEGTPRRALRRITVRVAPRTSHRAMDRMVFHDLEAPPGTRCYGEAGGAQPNLVGRLMVAFEGRNRPDTADYDFKDTLRRKGGFELRIASGVLRVGAPGRPLSELEAVDFSGGRVALLVVRRGSDAFRRLAEFGPRDRRTLVLGAPDGRSWSFDLVSWSAAGSR